MLRSSTRVSWMYRQEDIKMIKYNCLNPISQVGLDRLSDDYERTENFGEAQAVLVRSAAMHDMELSGSLLAVARAGAGVNNIPLDKCAEKGIVVFNTPGANANGVKELVIAAMIAASRNLIAANAWVEENKNDENIGKTMEKDLEQSAFWLQTPPTVSEWMSSAAIPSFQCRTRLTFQGA